MAMSRYVTVNENEGEERRKHVERKLNLRTAVNILYLYIAYL